MTKLDNELFIVKMETAQKYLEIQKVLSEKLRDSFYLMTLARHAGVKNTDSANWRENIDPQICLRPSIDNNDKLLLKKNDNGTNALLMIGGLPPKSLKQCKKSFESALNDIVQLVQLINQIKS